MGGRLDRINASHVTTKAQNAHPGSTNFHLHVCRGPGAGTRLRRTSMWLSRNGDFNTIAQNVAHRTCYLTNVSVILAIMGATSKSSKKTPPNGDSNTLAEVTWLIKVNEK